VLERDWFELFLDPSDHDRMRQALLHAKASDKPAPVSVSSLLRQGERKRHLHWSGVPLHDTRGLPFAVLVIGQDVTDLYEAQERMVRAERLAAIGQMATGVAHESRSALQRIGATAEMLELELEGNLAALELVARIQHAQQHLHQLLDEVRNYAAPIVLDCSKWSITETWREAWELLLAQRRGRQVELREHLVARDLTIVADRFRLVQVFRNLLENALAACEEPIRIDVTCESAVINGTDALRIRVRDNGAGMTPEQRRRIFEPFFTTKPTGTGLGTAIAQRLVEAHGGTLEVADDTTDGSELVVTIPSAPITGSTA
jgi:signal transduction histidine kinase